MQSELNATILKFLNCVLAPKILTSEYVDKVCTGDTAVYIQL